MIARISAKNEKLDPNLAKNLISRAKNAHWKIKEPEGESSLPAAVFHRYQEELKTANAVDFDDLLILTVNLFENHSDVAEKWQTRFRFIMVDEFQEPLVRRHDLPPDLVASTGATLCEVGKA